MRIFNPHSAKDQAAVNDKVVALQTLGMMIVETENQIRDTDSAEYAETSRQAKAALVEGRDAITRDLAAVAYWKN